MRKKTVEDIEVKNKRVLLRVDFNVPLDINTGAISDDSRIRASLPTIKYLVDHKAKVVLCSHLGRPKGKVVENLRMAPTAQRLSQLIGMPVSTASDCIGQEVESKVGELKEGEILVLENLRFHPEEEADDPEFAQKLAKLANVYVNDAFGTAHRVHASTVGIAKYLPAVAGFLMKKELEVMGKLLDNPERPLACLIGGAKVGDKIELLQNMLRKVDMLLVGGGMTATFLRTQGYEVGHSLMEEDKLGLARKLLQEAEELKVPFLLPIDAVVAEEIKDEAPTRVVPTTDIPAGSHIVDIGPGSIELFCSELRKCRTITWNGPMGIYEIPQFAQGTRSIASFLSTLNATTIIGGGSSAEIVQEMGLSDKMTHVSTGGGASLRFLEGVALPGVKVLLDKKITGGYEMRIPFIAGNWKMNTTTTQAEQLVLEMIEKIDRIEGVEKVLCPPFVSLVAINMMLEGLSIKLGAQNMHFETEGAYTGEISPLMLRELCEFVILGHSERRWYFGETDELVNKKVKAALANMLQPILCVGERLAENEASKTEEVVNRQVTAALNGIEPVSNLVIAYEPVWAIGTGKAASGKQAAATIQFIRDVVAKLWNESTAQDLRILYGGSVTSANIAEFISHPEIDGALVGGASLKAEEFTSIVEQTAEIKGRIK